MAIFKQRFKIKRNFLAKIWVFTLVLTVFLMMLLMTDLIAQGDDGFLKSDISSLQSRVSRLESEIGYLRQSLQQRSVSSSAAPRYQSPAIAPNSTLQRDPAFKQLAKLLIELREDMKDLEDRVNKLEKRNKPR